MPLIIEDGTAKPDANAYVAVADVRTFATDRGVDLSGLSDNSVIALILKATDYLESLGPRYVGSVSTGTQALSWPRLNVINQDGSSFPSSGPASIPLALKNGQCQLCLEVNNGVDLLPTVDNNVTGGFVVREKTDVLETQWSERVGTLKQPLMPKVDRWLQNLLSPRPGGITAVRV